MRTPDVSRDERTGRRATEYGQGLERLGIDDCDLLDLDEMICLADAMHLCGDPHRVALEDSQMVEVGTIGNERMAGLPMFLGTKTLPLTSFCQIPGDAARMTSDARRSEARPGDRLHELLHRFTEVTFVVTAQSSVCNRLHSVQQRCRRWLLHTQDRVGKDGFLLTQEFLSQMLGVRRASVCEVAGELQREGLIS